MRNDSNIDQLNELIERAKMGNVNAFTSIVNMHQHYAYAVAFKILCDEENSKDVVQESFIRIWKHIADYNQKSKFTTWMYKIVVNLCYDKLRRIKRQNHIIELSIDNLDVLANDDNPELKFEVGGHTDADGDDAYNLKLSQQRADAVKDMLAGQAGNE